MSVVRANRRQWANLATVQVISIEPDKFRDDDAVVVLAAWGNGKQVPLGTFASELEAARHVELLLDDAFGDPE